jgi:hypothetical protein
VDRSSSSETSEGRRSPALEDAAPVQAEARSPSGSAPADLQASALEGDKAVGNGEYPPRRRRKKRSKRRKLKQLASATVPLLFLLGMVVLAAGLVRVVEDSTKPQPVVRSDNEARGAAAQNGRNRYRLAPAQARQGMGGIPIKNAARRRAPEASDDSAGQVDIMDWDLGATGAGSKKPQPVRLDVEEFEIPGANESPEISGDELVSDQLLRGGRGLR